MNSFEKSFKARLEGDNAEVLASKAWRSAKSALEVQIAALNGDTVQLEDNVETTKENLLNAKVNDGKAISDRTQYVQNLIESQNELTTAESSLKKHKEKLKFLKGILDELKSTK